MHRENSRGVPNGHRPDLGCRARLVELPCRQRSPFLRFSRLGLLTYFRTLTPGQRLGLNTASSACWSLMEMQNEEKAAFWLLSEITSDTLQTLWSTRRAQMSSVDVPRSFITDIDCPGHARFNGCRLDSQSSRRCPHDWCLVDYLRCLSTSPDTSRLPLGQPESRVDRLLIATVSPRL